MVHQICILLWKNLLIRRNRYILTPVEVLLPLSLLLLINTSLSQHITVIDNDPLVFEAYKMGDCIPRHSHYGSIIYEPSTPFTTLLMKKAACFAGYMKTSVKAGSLSDNTTYFSIGVQLHVTNSSKPPRVLNYTLFPTNKALVKLHNLWRHDGTSIPKFSVPSIYTVVELQRAIDSSYMHIRNIVSPKITIENTDVYDRTPKAFTIAITFALFSAFSLMVPPIVSRIVLEKHTGAKELMLMMGVVRWQLWVAKFLDVIIFATITVGGIVLILCVPIRSDSSYVRISPLVLWAVLMYGLVGVILFLFCISCLFEKPKRATYATELIWCASFLLKYKIAAFPMVVIRAYLCLFPHVSLMESFSILMTFDNYEKEIKLMEKLPNISLFDVLQATGNSILLYSVLIWYAERAMPGKYGVPLPYNFFLKRSYWFPRKVVTSCDSDPADKPRDNFEPVPAHFKPGVRVVGVTKVYESADRGVVTAVDNVCLDFYSGEISGLLGHNGAGKTSLFSMITGFLYPTSGKITINGYDLGINIREARRSFGFCPQQDMLFNDLTAVQTLQFFGVVKGLSLKEAKLEADKLITKLQLSNVKNIEVCKLSGGQKRKVSLAIALIGGSQVLVLDEPTAGMDPEIRREIWEILLEFRSERTTLLTTHFMEEADLLCDRIAIMDHGKIKCYGSPMFLKEKHGEGYLLSIVIPDTGNWKELTEYVQKFVAAKPKSQNIRTLCFQLPETEVSNFPNLFSALDEKQTAGDITTYSISFSTLEDAFLRCGGVDNDEFDAVDSVGYKKLDMREDMDEGKPLKCRLFAKQFWALLLKKCIYFRRSYKSFLLYSILPPLLSLLFLFSVGNGRPRTGNVISKDSLTYSLDLYPSSLVLYSMPPHVNFEKPFFELMVKLSGSKAIQVNDTREALYNSFRDDFRKYARKIIMAVDFTPNDFRIYHNDDAVHMVPIALNFFHNYLLKYWHPDESIVTSVNVSYANKMFVLAQPRRTCNMETFWDFWGTQPMFYLSGPIEERIHGAKGLQLMLVSPFLYWFSHLIFDLFTFIFYEAVLLIGMGIAGDDVLKYPGETVFGFFFCGAGLILIQYLLSTVVNSTAAAFSVSLIAYVCFTFISYSAVDLEGPMSFLSYLHPNSYFKEGVKALCSEERSNFILALFLYLCVLFVVLLIKDSQLLSRAVHSFFTRFLAVDYSLKEEKDALVENEEASVRTLIQKDISASGLIVKDLRRWYWRRFRPSPTVRGISFTVNRAECFGLLGVNGAGKTTTFQILTGAIPASEGYSYACSEQLSLWNRQKYLFSIGYCPQFGGLIPVFKGVELLSLFARLRGIHGSQVKVEVFKWLEEMQLLEYAFENCGTYSGGNQRKLSTAIALIGESPLIFLDEPTTGVDPLSRRSIWNVIRDVQRQGRSVVLTSHSMDECEALCSRLAIMVKGRFRCIGETTTLKDRFGRGYSVQLKLWNRAAPEEVNELKKAMFQAFGQDCHLVDDHVTLLQYHISKKITWKDLFSELDCLRTRHDILESFTASATTLEQIFIHFARSTGETV